MSKIVIAQVFVLLSSIKEEKDDVAKWEQLKKVSWSRGRVLYCFHAYQP